MTHVLSTSLLAAAAATLLACAPATQNPTDDEALTMRAVAQMLSLRHVSGEPVDDRASERAFDAYLDAMDGQRLYFLKSDVDEFAKQRDQLDDLLKAGDPSFAKLVYGRLLERADARLALAKELVKNDYDFTVDEYFDQGEDVPWPVDEAAAKERWRKRIKLDLLQLHADGIEGQTAQDRLVRRYETALDRLHELDSEDLISTFVGAFAGSYDPHTAYLSPSSLEEFRIAMRLNYQGIGARLEDQDGTPVIADLIPGGAAEKSGNVEPGDRIVAVGEGTDGSMQEVFGMRLDDVVHLIRGTAGTVVRLKLARGTPPKSLEIDLTRAQTELADAAASGRMLEHEGSDGKVTHVGLIDLPSFYGSDHRRCSDDVADVVRDLKGKGADVMVLDLRENGGGLLDEAVRVAGLFIDSGPVVQVKDSRGRVRCDSDDDGETVWDGPLVVLISRSSASASEIVAGALQDYDRALVVGDPTTHGKGTVQMVMDVAQLVRGSGSGDLGALKVTIQQFYRPDGASTQLKGVAADVVLPSWMAAFAKGEAGLPGALPFDRIAPAKHRDCGMLTDRVLHEVSQASEARRAHSEWWQKLAEKTAALAKRDLDKVPLSQKRFDEYRSELDAVRKEIATHLDESKAGDKTSDPYLDEVTAIASDYVNDLHEPAVAGR